MAPPDFRDKSIAIVGMQKSGFGAAELLLRHGARVRGVDAKPTDEMVARCAELGIEFVPQSSDAFADVDLAVLSPAVPPSAWPTGVPVVGEIELASYFLRGPIIAVTGSNGKTTTTSLIGHILTSAGIANQVGGNIGIAPTAMVDSSRPDQWNVLEVSSFQLAPIREFRAHIAVVTNVTQNHLDWHGGFEHYASSKARLVETQTADDYAVLNAGDPVCRSFAERTRARVVWFNTGDDLPDQRDVPLRGRHNLENVAAATAATRLAGATLEQIRAAVTTFQAVEHRIEFVRRLHGVDYYNDSKATSVDATLKAIDAFDGGLWIILGGKDKGSDYTVLREPLRAKAKGALLIGAAADKIASHLGDAVPVMQCGDLATAVRVGRERAREGDTVLLAPACASFDQFSSFEHRGRVFKEIVGGLE